jgi:hypothetical protein
MYTKDLIVRGYIERNGDLWVAVCVDIPLAAQSDTPEGAAEKLKSQIYDYLCEAFSEPKYTASILSRKAPIAHRLKHHAYRTLLALHAIKSSLVRPFESPVPMKPCHH